MESIYCVFYKKEFKMKRIYCLLVLLIIGAMLLSSCAPQISPFPEGSFSNNVELGVIGSILQTGDGNAYVRGSVPSPRTRARALFSQPVASGDEGVNKHLVTFEHKFGDRCCVSGYIGSSLYIIQDFGSLGWNRKGVGHKDGTVLLKYGEDGYFSISSLSENKLIVGNPTDSSVTSLWDDTSSYAFGYMVYDEENKKLRPMYAENNLRFYTAGYFINGVAQVSVKEDDKILFGVIDSDGNYIVEPKYEMMADESADDIVIVGLNAENASEDENYHDTCGRNIYYDSTLMTNVQFTRNYACSSQSVGLIDRVTGRVILPCSYDYIERVMDDTYFVIDRGEDYTSTKYLYDVSDNRFTHVTEGIYSYFNSEWMMYIKDNGAAYLADKRLALYETTGLDVVAYVYDVRDNVSRLINTNIISARRDENAEMFYLDNYSDELRTEYDSEKCTYTLTVEVTGDVIQDVISFATPYDGAFLYTVENSLYRYDLSTGVSAKIDTGYGDFTEDYDSLGARYYADLNEIGEGVYTLRYNLEYESGYSQYLIIINDEGRVLFDASINDVEKVTKNYLGKYDDALYSLAGGTSLEDNYYLTTHDGEHYLIQFVRGETDGSEWGTEDDSRYTRTIDSFATFSLLSPFKLELADGGDIAVLIDGEALSTDNYIYNSEECSLKLLTQMFYSNLDLFEQLWADQFLELTVITGNQSIKLRIEISPFAYQL